MGETRARRIEEFLEENDVAVLGMREGCSLRRGGDILRLNGMTGARLFIRNAEPREIAPGTDLSWMLEVPAHFDQSIRVIDKITKLKEFPGNERDTSE
jgi:dipeptidase E